MILGGFLRIGFDKLGHRPNHRVHAELLVALGFLADHVRVKFHLENSPRAEAKYGPGHICDKAVFKGESTIE